MSKIKTPTEPKERKAPVRNPRYEVARLEIAEIKVLHSIVDENVRHEGRIMQLKLDLANAREELSNLRAKVENGGEPQLPLD